jgi:catechol 2,3-dioxygenase-like lactoylglutathione lyase family enzyme
MSSLFTDIAYICLYCANMEESIHFYGEVLGLRVERHHPDFCQFSLGTVRLGLEPGGWRKGGQKSWSENPVLLQFRAHSLEQLEAMNRQLEAHTVTLLARSIATSYGVITSFLDPDGNKLEVLYKEDTQ